MARNLIVHNAMVPNVHAGHGGATQGEPPADGIPRTQLRTPWSSCVVSSFGGQLLSFKPARGAEVFWMTANPLPLPKPIRGGVPLCWPWFARQGVPNDAPQHGTVRTLPWRIDAIATTEDGTVSLAMSPDTTQRVRHPSDHVSDALSLSLEIVVGRTLTMTLVTRNRSPIEQPLTQALHGYFALGDIAAARIEGLDGVAFQDNRAAGAIRSQRGAFSAPAACERIYHGFAGDPAVTLVDERESRRISLTTEGCRSLVVWNPGEDLAAGIADMPTGGWRRFVCIEAANAGPDRRRLAPGQVHRLTQRIEVTRA